MYNATLRNRPVLPTTNFSSSSAQSTHRNNSSGISGGYKLLYAVVGLAIITFLSSTLTLQYNTRSTVPIQTSSSAPSSNLAKNIMNSRSFLSSVYNYLPSYLLGNIPINIFQTASTFLPTTQPSNAPTLFPSQKPTKNPTKLPSALPTEHPTALPSEYPTASPSYLPTAAPTAPPSSSPSHLPSSTSTSPPSVEPTQPPTSSPTTANPSTTPTALPSDASIVPPSVHPSISPTTLSTLSSTLTASSTTPPALTNTGSPPIDTTSTTSTHTTLNLTLTQTNSPTLTNLTLTSPRNSSRCKESFPPVCSAGDALYSYVRFWNKRFSLNDCYASPLKFDPLTQPPQEEKYVVFEPDRGGWNNIRMAAETAMLFAHATGRTLVLPPQEKWYLLDKGSHPDENKASFRMFFDLSKVSEAMKIISMEQFLDTVAFKGLLKQPIPPRFRTAQAFIGEKTYWEGNNRVYRYLETACHTRVWETVKTFVGFNITHDKQFGTINTDISGTNSADPNTRFRKMTVGGRRTMFAYDQQLHSERCLFFPGDYRDEYRLLIHYYVYLYWADPHLEQIYKRIVRDRLHYHDDIFCAAGRIVRSIHADAANLSASSPGGPKQVQPLERASPKTLGGDTNRDATYFAFHIRRGDFQYKDTQLTAEQIWANTRPLLDPNVSSLIYIATDETNKSFFRPFLESGEFTVRFLSDYTARAGKYLVNNNHVGMVEQVVCANAHTFIGTPFSTFTGYITRMRGYYRDGRYERTYYTMKNRMYQLHRERDIHGPFWAREFEIAHRDIDDYY